MKKYILSIFMLFCLISFAFAGPQISSNGGGAVGAGTGDLLADGSVPLTSNWDVGAFTITALRFVSDQATGTAPFTVASTTLVANLYGARAVLADTVTIADNESTNENNAVVFLPGGDLDGGDLALESDGTFYYNPSTGTVTATAFAGNLTGAVTGNADTATNSTTVTLTDNESTAENNPVWFSAGAAGSGSVGAEADGDFYYTPSTGVVTATGFAGALTGNVTGNVTGNASGSSGSCTGNSATATLAGTVTITDNESSAENNALVFLPNGDLDGGNLALESDGDLYYNPSTGTLTVPNLVATTSVTSGAVEDPLAKWDALDADDTDWWIGTNADAGASSDDNLEFRLSSTPGTSVIGWLEPDTGDFGLNGAMFLLEQATAGTDVATYGQIWVKNTTPNELWFTDDAGTDFQLGTSAATTWDAIGAPTADKAFSFDDDEITSFSFADTDEDMFVVNGIGAFGDVSVMKISQNTGDPTDGTVLEVVAADANVDPLVVSSSGQAAALVVGQNAGNVSMAATTEASAIGTAALVTAGGLGVAKDIWVGDDIVLDSDSTVISLGADQDITVTHVADAGLNLKQVTDADDNPFILVLQTGETDMAEDDVLGGIYFQAPDEGTGTDAVLVAAGIEAVSEGDFAADSNATKLSFKTAASETATEKMYLSSAGNLSVSGSVVATKFIQGGIAQFKDGAASGDIQALSDTTSVGTDGDPLELTTAEMMGTTVTNLGAGGALYFLLPAAAIGINTIFNIDVAQAIHLKPPAGTKFYYKDYDETGFTETTSADKDIQCATSVAIGDRVMVQARPVGAGIQYFVWTDTDSCTFEAE